MATTRFGLILVLCCSASVWSGCGDDSMDDDDATKDNGPNAQAGSKAPADAGKVADDEQMPPMGYAEITEWLDKGDYKDWNCEPAVHEARSPSPHGFNRICSNDLIADNAGGKADWPKGAAAVKELYASASAKTPVGYAVYLKTDEDSADGENWYWYEVVPSDSAAPHDDDGVVADGMGDDGSAKDICVGCHLGAGSDAAHTPSKGGRDQVYTPVE